MSYLVLPGGVPGFTKAVISLWFQVPQATIYAAAQEFDAAWSSGGIFSYGSGWVGGGGGFSGYTTQPPQMAGIIPLLTFGKSGTQSSWDFVRKDFGTFHVTQYFWFPLPGGGGEWRVGSEGDDTISNFVYVAGETWNTELSYIGVWCTADPPRSLLAVNLETQAHAAMTGVVPNVVDVQASDRQFYTGPEEFMPARTFTSTTTYGDVNPNLIVNRTEGFRTHPWVSDIAQYDGTTGLSPPFGITVTPDQWHHLLLSFDLTTPCVTHGISSNDPSELAVANNATSPQQFVDSAPKMWSAFDDVNKQGRDLSYYWPGKGASGGDGSDKPDDSSADPNEVLSANGWRIASTTIAADSVTVTEPDATNETNIATITGLSQPTYNSGTVPIPAQGASMGLPASVELVDHIRHIEMAEFQMWTGVAIDTSVEANRRAFIDYKRDANGVPIPDKNGNLTLIPVNPAKAAKLIGRKPDIELHKSGNWIKGNNTGATGVGPDGKPISTGQFTPTGVIKKYKPDPSIVVT